MTTEAAGSSTIATTRGRGERASLVGPVEQIVASYFKPTRPDSINDEHQLHLRPHGRRDAFTPAGPAPPTAARRAAWRGPPGGRVVSGKYLAPPGRGSSWTGTRRAAKSSQSSRTWERRTCRGIPPGSRSRLIRARWSGGRSSSSVPSVWGSSEGRDGSTRGGRGGQVGPEPRWLRDFSPASRPAARQSRRLVVSASPAGGGEGFQGVLIDRLGQVMVEARLARAAEVHGLAVPGHSHEERVFTAFLRAKPLDDLIAGQAAVGGVEAAIHREVAGGGIAPRSNRSGRCLPSRCRVPQRLDGERVDSCPFFGVRREHENRGPTMGGELVRERFRHLRAPRVVGVDGAKRIDPSR
jgi:hypothetical protein